MKKTKKIALIMLTVVLMAVCFVFGASALEETGQCGDNIYWDYDSTSGELILSGEGAMWDYEGESPFKNSDIKNLIIESGITHIGIEAFSECSELNNLIIPYSVTSIGESAFFNCNNITNVKIPEGVCEIGSYAFQHCVRLKEITISASVTFLGEFVFYECFNLERIIVDENNLNYSSDSRGVLFNKEKTVLIWYPAGNYNTTYVIPESVKNIEIAAFLCAIHLEEIMIPENVEIIGYGAFQQCFNVTTITISDGITTIDDTAFLGHPFLEEIIVKDMDAEIGYGAFGQFYTVIDIERADFIDLTIKSFYDENSAEEFRKHLIYSDSIFHIGKIYCHAGSTAEAYAIENGADYELTHFFEGDWSYDYDNMIRTRKCIHCDELQVEALEIDEISGDSFLVIEETVTNGIEGDVEVLKAFDINLKNGEGVHVQPDGTIKVKLPNDWTKQGVYKVYRVNDDGTLTDMNAYREGSHLVFETDHFSIYVIVVENEETEPDEPVVPDIPDEPTEPEESECRCFCHKKGVFFELLVIIFKFVIKIVGVAPLCDCGIAHY